MSASKHKGMGRMMRAVLVVGLLGVLLPTPAAGQELPPTNEIDIRGFQFLPPVSLVEAGEDVIWRNVEPAGIPHNVFPLAYFTPSGEMQPHPIICPEMGPGGSCTRKAGSADLPRGTYLYTCTVAFHAALMRGVLVVD